MNAIVTLSIGSNYRKTAELTHPSIKEYAKKINADFIDLSTLFKDNEHPHWCKLYLYTLLQEFERIIWMDSDIIVRDDCPDLFKIVPKEKIGIFEEGSHSPRSEFMLAGMNAYKEFFKWNGQYFNTGVMVLSKKHARLFIKPSEELIRSEVTLTNGAIQPLLGEQTYLNIKLLNDTYLSKNIFELNYRFNRMELMDKILGEHRRASYIVHYAGCPSQDLLLKLIQKDLEAWKKETPNYIYKKKIVLSVSGGLGDQVCGEPVVRYFKDKLFPNDNVTILTHFPEIFKHLKLPTYPHEHIFDFTKGPYNIRYVYPDTTKPIWRFLSNSTINTTEFGGISTCNRILPDKDKRIYLEPSFNSLNEISDIVPNEIAKELILLHPGYGYEAKTFPVEWWNQVIHGLLEKGKQVGLIGKTIDNDRGYLNVDCPDGVVDFRDFLSLDGLMTIIGMARILISNDSAPVHIAGAFDNWIILIPTLKHPDHVLPFRYGYKYYKARALYKRLTIEDYSEKTSGQRLDLLSEDIMKYIPTPQEVIDCVLEIESIDENVWNILKD